MKKYQKGLSLIVSVGLMGLATPFAVYATEVNRDMVTDATVAMETTQAEIVEAAEIAVCESDAEAVFGYSLDANNHAIITSYNGISTEVTIPETLDGYSVVTIGDRAFYENTELTKVVIPDSVTAIEEYAFYGCSNLVNVELPSSLNAISFMAFGNCDGLTSIEIPKSLTSVVKYYTWEDNNRNDGPFNGCDSLKEVTFEEGVTQIHNNLFQNCSGIETIEIPGTVTSIGECAFSNCSNLKEVTFAGNDLDITVGRYAFYSCSNLEKVKLSDGITSIGRQAFGYCTKLAEANLPKSLKSIDYGAFIECDALTSVVIPKSLNTVNPYLKTDYNNKNEGVFNGCNNLKEVTFEEGVTKICNNFFQNCPGIETIEIPATVMSIGECAFSNCGNLKEVSFVDGDRYITIDQYAFFNCANLECAKLSDGITTIGKYVFSKCTKLAEVNLPKSLTTLWYGAFNDCDALTSVEIPKSLNRVVTYALVSQDNMAEGPFINCNNLKEVTFEEGTTTVCNSLFQNCPGLEKIEIPADITSIGVGAFMNCSNLTEVSLQSVDASVSIGEYAFYNCDRIAAIEIPDNVASLGEYTFAHCDKLTDVTLGSGITAIPRYAFYSCTGLEEIVLPYRVQKVEDYAFDECSLLLEATLPRAVTSMGKDVFHYTTNMTIYGVAGTYAEQYAEDLGARFVNIGESISSIAFQNAQISLYKGASKMLITSVTPAAFTEEMNWSSDNTDIVTVSGNGTITANAVGSTKVRVTIGSVSAECEVNVMGELGDVSEDSWKYAPALYVYERGIMTGKGTDENGNVVFAPDANLTRQEFAQIIYAAENKPAFTTDMTFTDLVEGQWYVNAVLWAAENGIVSGVGNGAFGVDNNITREQLALMLYKYAELKGYDISASMELDEFADRASVNTWSETALKWAVANGIMSGKSGAAGTNEKNLDPQGFASRAECATMLKAFMTKFDAE